jgi:hypothetical protein
MKTLATPHGIYRTGDALAEAAVRASLDLARRHEIEMIDLPFVDSGGALARATLPIGWGCHIAARTDAARDDLVDHAALERIRHTGAVEITARGIVFAADEIARIDWSSEWSSLEDDVESG